MQNKKDSSWGKYLTKKVEDTKTFFTTVNNLGVKAPVTNWAQLNANIPVDNEGLEEDQTKIDTYPARRNIRSIDKNSTYAPDLTNHTNTTFAPDLINLTNTTFAPDLTNLTNTTFAPDLTNLTNTTFAPDLTNLTNTTYAPDLINHTNTTFAPEFTNHTNTTFAPEFTNHTNTTFAPDLTNRTNTTFAPDLINSFKLSDEDKNFIDNELRLRRSTELYIRKIYISYRWLLRAISTMSNTARNNKDFLNYITSDIVLMSKCFGDIKLFVNSAFFVIEDEKGRLGFASHYGMQVMDMKNYNYLEYIINHIPQVTRVLNISANMLNQYQRHYQKLLDNDFNKENISTHQPKEVFTKVLSSLKAITTREQDLDRYLYDLSNINKQVFLFGKIFGNEASAKACLENMNRNLLLNKFPDFDLYKSIDSLDENIEDLKKGYELLHNKLNSNKTVNASSIVRRSYFFNRHMRSDKRVFSQPSPIQNLQCVNPETLPTLETNPSTVNTTIPRIGNTTTPSTWNRVHTTVRSNTTDSTEIIAVSLLAFIMFANIIKFLWDIYYEVNQTLATGNITNIEMTVMPQEGNGVSATESSGESRQLLRSNSQNSEDPSIPGPSRSRVEAISMV